MIEVFNPTDPSLSDSDIEYECWPPSHNDDEEIETVIVYTEREAEAYEKLGYDVFAWPREK